MGSVGAKTDTAIQFEEPVINTKYYKSTTQQMKDIVTDVYKDMQKEFPILANSVEFQFWNGGDHETIGDTIYINGRHLKQMLNRDDEEWIRGMVAHELTHVIQQRIAYAESRRLKEAGAFEAGRDYAEEISTRILDNAIEKYRANNNAISKEQLYKDLKKAYGYDWDRAHGFGAGRNAGMERMATAFERAYRRKGQAPDSRAVLAELGRYVASEMEKAQAGLTYKRRQ